MLKSFRHYLRPDKAKDTTASIAWRREAWKEEALDDFLERTREGHGQSDEHLNCFIGNVGDISERRGEAQKWPFRAHRNHFELN